MGANETEESDHEFTEAEYSMMMYEKDEGAFPVIEYHYMKDEWKHGAPSKKKSALPDLRKYAKDSGRKTLVDLNKLAPEDEKPVPLLLDTSGRAIVVEFYAPWCGYVHGNSSYTPHDPSSHSFLFSSDTVEGSKRSTSRWLKRS
mmetsp:Transcript_23898/g.55751  ORF Transcript_23898/g.55751 Transcript_23898/m.55751 type:complete len:144 (+) Transcript_23898:2-433(+)